MALQINKKLLDELYSRYNRREFVHPDPLEFLYRYQEPMDREIAGLIASALAFGRVAQIIRNVAAVLDLMSPSPRLFLEKTSSRELRNKLAGFKHRWATGAQMAELLMSVKRINTDYGSLYNCFLAGYNESDENVIPALCRFAGEIEGDIKDQSCRLVASPQGGSACKRMNLFLRWMVRSDAVDPGGWDLIQASKLIVPLDTHIHRICLALGITDRRQADLKTAVQVTSAFAGVSPRDPVKYDFCLSRLGIRTDTDLDAFLNQWKRGLNNCK